MRYYCPHCRGLVGVEIKEHEYGDIVDREIVCGKCHMTIRSYTCEKDKKDKIYTYQKEENNGNIRKKAGKNHRIAKGKARKSREGKR